MKKTLIILALAAISFGFVQSQQSQEVTVKITAQEAEYVLQVLAKRPYEESAVLINKIATQVNPQIKK